ncbi:Rab3-GTPase cat domain containing protein [Trichuris trichiura]|uniref:Rab3 GTPase-activating protein catalytic subunit n=1 Tax=Trichuris trichiura TaxID=36087 RepID=A0A077ZN92_TRITR|nr:Rab3-GTPase cat domain containing protein [Trichuris trichiura]
MESEDPPEILDYTNATDWERFISNIEAVFRRWRADGLERPDCKNEHNELAACFHTSLEYKGNLFNASYFCPRNATYKTDESSIENDGSERLFSPAVSKMQCKTTSQELLEPLDLSLLFALNEYLAVTPVDCNEEDFEKEKQAIISAFLVASTNVDWQIPVMFAYPVGASAVEVSDPIYVGFCRNDSFYTHFEMARLPLSCLNCHYLSDWVDIFRTEVATLEASPESVVVSARRTYELVGHSSRPLLMQNILYWCVKHCGEAAENFKKLAPSCFDFPCSFELMIVWQNRNEEMLMETASYSDLNASTTPHWYLKLASADFELESSPFTKLIFLIESSELVSEWLDPSVRSFSGMDNEISNLTNYIFHERESNDMLKRNSAWFTGFDRIQKMIADYRSSKCGLMCERIGIAVLRLLIDCTPRFYQTNVKRALALLWDELLYELRSRWLNGILLDDKQISLPKVVSWPLHQNIEMLNFGIAHERTNRLLEFDEATADADNSSCEDDFFDCKESVTTSKDDGLPEGRLAIAEGLFQLENENEPLYTPIYQETVPFIAESGGEHPFDKRSLDTLAEDVEQSKRYSRAVLFSDMQAFKAANPGSCFQDFLRLHSPRDVVESVDETTGKRTYSLSPRMSAEENLWRSLWEKARPIAAACQRPLVHHARKPDKELDKAVLDLETKVHMYETVALTLKSHCRGSVSEEVEKFAYQLVSLKKEKVVGGAASPVGRMIDNLFSLSKPSERPDHENYVVAQNDSALINERYILRWFVARPSNLSCRSPQRMCIELRHKEGYFVSSASLTEDTDFFLE